ncbi:hypothetical protein L3Q82_014405 [Scortum barcoo]|uniref:Uncharacterized protein n=1 Tax=Scortum barcoo TaxID=214431 RepID=A0ACB8VXD4_9TELE|nr:hypothetical protein L3Q82_014405 [Scortum barcoo]
MSHIVFIAMQIPWSLCVLVALFSANAAHPCNDSQGLSCVNDLVNNVSCTWNSSLMAPGVDCRITGAFQSRKIGHVNRHETITRNCKLEQHGNSPPGCSFVFENYTFNPFTKLPSIRMDCDGTLVAILSDYKTRDHIKMQPPSAPSVSSTANETLISWNAGSPVASVFNIFDFEVQITQKKQNWKEVSILPTLKFEERIASWKLTGLCQVRVRVKPAHTEHSQWSNWSPATSWVAATDRREMPQDQESPLDQTSWLIRRVMLSLSPILAVVMLVLYRSCMSRGIHKRKPVPNPSKYFHTLHSVYGGNLKKWMNPLSASESFFTAQPCDPISQVEVYKIWDAAPSTSISSSSTTALLNFRSCPSAGSDTSGVIDNSSSSTSSCFSNMGYFMSRSSSSSALTNPSPAYFTYQDDLHNLNNGHNVQLCPSFTTSPTYESLKREPQSPDSGFGIGKEDEEDREEKKLADAERDVVSDDHQSSPVLVLPLHLPSWMCPPPSPPPTPNAPSLHQVSSDNQQMDTPVAAESGSYAAWPLAGSMSRSSSMPVESCKTGYLTLKELQTTFSNKSI